MCIIAIFKDGKRPDKATIKRMMDTNRDGVGIAWNTGKNACFRKGFTTVDSVEAFIERLTATAGVGDIVFHARIGTSGGVSTEKCHPFPVSGCDEQLNRTTYCGNAPLVFHNGVFSIDIEAGLSDSQTFVKRMIYPLWKADPKGLLKGRYDGIINMAVKGSRLVIMYADGWRAYGTGWCEEDEAWYSNSGYKAYTYTRGGWYDGDWGWEYDREYEEFEKYRKGGWSKASLFGVEKPASKGVRNRDEK